MMFEYQPEVTRSSTFVAPKKWLDNVLLKRADGGSGVITDPPEDLDEVANRRLKCGFAQVEEYAVKEFRADLDYYFRGCFDYYAKAFHADLGAEVAPWTFYNMVFSQVVALVKNDEAYRSLFTKSNDKITVVVSGGHDTFVDELTDKIRKMLPDGTWDAFFPAWPRPESLPAGFETSMKGLFAELVENYYGCVKALCVIPRYRVLGEQDDWDVLHSAVVRLKELFATVKPLPYLDKVSAYTDELRNNWNKADCWRNFFDIKMCGSGHSEVVLGDILRLLPDKPNNYEVPDLPKTICRYPFGVMTEPESKYAYLAGMIGGKVDDAGVLVPVYDEAFVRTTPQTLSLSDREVELMRVDAGRIRNLERLRQVTYNRRYPGSGDGENVRDAYWMKAPRSKVKKIHAAFREGEEKARELLQRWEAKRLEKVSVRGNVWLAGATVDKDCKITLDQYLANRDEARKLYGFLTDPEEAKAFYERCKGYRGYCIDDNSNEYALMTFDVEVWRIRCRCRPDDFSYFFSTFSTLFGGYLPKIEMADDLKQHLERQFFAEFKEESIRYINEMIAKYGYRKPEASEHGKAYLAKIESFALEKLGLRI